MLVLMPQKIIWLRSSATSPGRPLFLHGFSIVYRPPRSLPDDIDVIMVARRHRSAATPPAQASFRFAVSDATGRAEERRLAVKSALTGPVPDNIEHEVYSDLTGERGFMGALGVMEGSDGFAAMATAPAKRSMKRSRSLPRASSGSWMKTAWTGCS